MSYGIDTTGINLPSTQEIRSELVTQARDSFGEQINTESNGPLGNVIDIMTTETKKLYNMLDDVYQSQYPDSAEGVNLDYVVALTGITRLQSAKSLVTARIQGIFGTTVPEGFGASIINQEESKFVTTEVATLGAGINAQQELVFDEVPVSGIIILEFDGLLTGAINFSITNPPAAILVQNALNALATLSDVVVVADYTIGLKLTIQFTQADGQKPQPLLVIAINTTTDVNSNPVVALLTTKRDGFLPFADVSMQSIESGAINTNSNTLTVIDTPTSGILSVTNLNPSIPGRDVETDAALRIRRKQSLQTTQNSTDSGIRNKLLTGVSDVLQATVTSNRESTTVGGIPEHTLHAVVLGGTNQDIAEAIESTRPCGIGTFGVVTVPVQDSQGNTVNINFSRPTEIEIHFIINIEQNTDPIDGPLFPTDGEDQIKTAVVNFGQDLLIGQDVILNRFFTPINTVAGIIGIEILAGTVTPPTLSDNIAINNSEIARFSNARITVNVT